MKRANYIGAPAYFHLNQACRLINDAYGGFGCYLVGSSLERRDFRDVDVRFIMEDAEYDRLFITEQTATNARWSLMCMTISLWLSQQTGLPIDFQFQKQSHANATYPGQRQALGIFLDYPGDRPVEPAQKEG